MKKFFAILLGIVDVFCVGLIFYLMLSNLSGTPAQIFLPILPPTLAFSTVTGGTGMGILWIMLRQGQAKTAVQQG